MLFFWNFLFIKELRKNASDRAGASMSCKARFSFHSPHKRLGMRLIARIYLG